MKDSKGYKSGGKVMRYDVGGLAGIPVIRAPKGPIKRRPTPEEIDAGYEGLDIPEEDRIPKKKKKPGEPYYSSKGLRGGFEQTLPAATSSAQFRKGPLGALSPRAAIQDTVTRGMDLFRDEEGKRGSRLARKVAGEVENQKAKKKKPVKKNMGGMMKYANGGKVRGAGMARRKRT